ncbi:hypothetical protein ACLOJK_031489 [Asimina triloba]
MDPLYSRCGSAVDYTCTVGMKASVKGKLLISDIRNLAANPLPLFLLPLESFKFSPFLPTLSTPRTLPCTDTSRETENKMQSTKSTTAKSSIPAVDQRAHFRKPLQPKNFNSSNPPTTTHGKPKKIKILLPLPSAAAGNENKENRRTAGLFDASLAEELVAMRRKMERLREEKEKTEEVLSQRERRLDEMMREMERRWTEQRAVQIEVDRIRRLKQLNDSCTVKSPSFSYFLYSNVDTQAERDGRYSDKWGITHLISSQEENFQMTAMEKEDEEKEAIESVEKGKTIDETGQYDGHTVKKVSKVSRLI